MAILRAAGGVDERYGYDAFGPVRVMDANFATRSSSTCSWNWLYHGEFLDTESGMYDYGYRFYHPALGRWASRDPIGERGGLNLYEFVGNDGLNNWDYLGNADGDPDPVETDGPELYPEEFSGGEAIDPTYRYLVFAEIIAFGNCGCTDPLTLKRVDCYGAVGGAKKYFRGSDWNTTQKRALGDVYLAAVKVAMESCTGRCNEFELNGIERNGRIIDLIGNRYRDIGPRVLGPWLNPAVWA